MFLSIWKFSNKQNVKNASKEEKRMLATESTKHDDEDILDDSQEELTVDKAIKLYRPDFVPNQRITTLTFQLYHHIVTKKESKAPFVLLSYIGCYHMGHRRNM